MSLRHCATCDIYGDYLSRFCDRCAQKLADRADEPCRACAAAVNFAKAFRIDVGLVEAFAAYERAQHSEDCPNAKVTNG
jgi:hypothetical protein